MFHPKAELLSNNSIRPYMGLVSSDYRGSFGSKGDIVISKHVLLTSIFFHVTAYELTVKNICEVCRHTFSSS